MGTMEEYEKMDQEREEEDARRDACLEVADRLQRAAVQAGKALQTAIVNGISTKELHEVLERLDAARLDYAIKADKEAGE